MGGGSSVWVMFLFFSGGSWRSRFPLGCREEIGKGEKPEDKSRFSLSKLFRHGWHNVDGCVVEHNNARKGLLPAAAVFAACGDDVGLLSRLTLLLFSSQHTHALSC